MNNHIQHIAKLINEDNINEAVEQFWNKSTTTHTKAKVTMQAENFSGQLTNTGLCIYLVGDPSSGLARHVGEKRNLGFINNEKHVIVEWEENTAMALARWCASNDDYKGITVICGDITDVVRRIGYNKVEHLDFDGTMNYAGWMSKFMKEAIGKVSNIHLVCSARGSIGPFLEANPDLEKRFYQELDQDYKDYYAMSQRHKTLPGRLIKKISSKGKESYSWSPTGKKSKSPAMRDVSQKEESEKTEVLENRLQYEILGIISQGITKPTRPNEPGREEPIALTTIYHSHRIGKTPGGIPVLNKALEELLNKQWAYELEPEPAEPEPEPEPAEPEPAEPEPAEPEPTNTRAECQTCKSFLDAGRPYKCRRHEKKSTIRKPHRTRTRNQGPRPRGPGTRHESIINIANIITEDPDVFQTLGSQRQFKLTRLGWEELDRFEEILDRLGEGQKVTHSVSKGTPEGGSKTNWQRILNLDLKEFAQEAGYKDLIMPYISGGGIDLKNAKLVTLRSTSSHGDIKGWVDSNDYLKVTSLSNQAFLGHDPQIFGNAGIQPDYEISIVPEEAIGLPLRADPKAKNQESIETVAQEYGVSPWELIQQIGEKELIKVPFIDIRDVREEGSPMIMQVFNNPDIKVEKTSRVPTDLFLKWGDLLNFYVTACSQCREKTWTLTARPGCKPEDDIHKSLDAEGTEGEGRLVPSKAVAMPSLEPRSNKLLKHAHKLLQKRSGKAEDLNTSLELADQLADNPDTALMLYIMVLRKWPHHPKNIEIRNKMRNLNDKLGEGFDVRLNSLLSVLLEINFKEPGGTDGIDPYDLKQPLPELPDHDWEVVIEMLGAGEISPSDAFHLGLSKREIESVIQRPVTDEELRG